MGTLTLVGVICAILLGLISMSITAVAKRIWPRLLSAAKIVGRKLPQPIRHPLRRGADSFYPHWRMIAGETVSRAPLPERVAKLRQYKRHDYFIVGAVYIDLTLAPVVESILDASEHGDLDKVSIDCGGSAWFVGRYLDRKFGKKSTLYTKIGSAGPLTRSCYGERRRLTSHMSETAYLGIV